MRAQDLAGDAMDELGGGSSDSPFGSSDESEVVAYMRKFLKAAQMKDPVAMAKAFKGAAEACKSYADDASSDE